jgi:D-sedoheptulose 7-phosphate isomerase
MTGQQHARVSDNLLADVSAYFRGGAALRMEVADKCGPSIVRAAELAVRCVESGGKLILFGNGGSAADAQHLAAEFVARFVLNRRALAALALTTDSSIVTAIGNDFGFEQVFSRQIEALAAPNDLVIAISTSGNSPNVLAGVRAATARRLKSIGLTGNDGGALGKCVDICLVVPCSRTAWIQECHIAIGHLLCELVEQTLFGAGSNSGAMTGSSARAVEVEA